MFAHAVYVILTAMHFSPLLHGSFGILDEVLIAAQAVLLIALLVSFVRARRKRKAQTSDESSHSATQH